MLHRNPDPATVTLAIQTGVALTKAIIGTINEAAANAAKNVLTYIGSGQYVSPVNAAKLLNAFSASKAKQQALYDAAMDDLKRKAAPSFTDAYKRRGNATAYLINKYASALDIPEYERLKLQARIYKRFANNSKASSLEKSAQWAFTTYKGHFKPGSSGSDAVVAAPGGSNALLIGGAVLLGAFLLFRRKGDA
jgi:hypothetical protein